MTPWADMGPAEVDDTDARMYQLKNMAGEKVNTYTFYIGKVCGIQHGRQLFAAGMCVYGRVDGWHGKLSQIPTRSTRHSWHCTI